MLKYYYRYLSADVVYKIKATWNCDRVHKLSHSFCIIGIFTPKNQCEQFTKMCILKI